MSEQAATEPSHIVLVVGIDLSDVSEHLLRRARDLVRKVDMAELHVVHVVRPEPLRERITEPVIIHTDASREGPETRALRESARCELERLCQSIVGNSGAKWYVHVPVGRTADALARIARDVHADVVVVEAHEHSWAHRAFHRSVIASIARDAPCSVLTIRPPHPQPESRQPDSVPAPA